MQPEITSESVSHPADSVSLLPDDNSPPSTSGPTGPPGSPGNSDGNTAQMQSATTNSDEHEIERKKTKREIVEELKQKTKKARWNVFLFLGVGAILFSFALFPMSTPGFWEGSNLESDPLDPTGQINSRILIFGIPGLEVKVDAEVWVEDLHGGDIEVYLVPGYCDDEDLLSTTSEMKEENSSGYALIEDAAPGSAREVELSADPSGAHCFVTWYSNSHVAQPSLEAAVHVYSNRVPAGILATASLAMSGFAFLGAQRHGRQMKELLAPASKKTPEEEALEAAQLSRLSLGPGMTPEVGPSEPGHVEIRPPSDGPPEKILPVVESSVDVTIPEAVPASSSPSPGPSPPPTPSPLADTPTEAEPDYVATGDGYFYIRNADGSFQPQAYYQGPDGRYWPYEG